jgi:membrane protease subunit HflC
MLMRVVLAVLAVLLIGSFFVFRVDQTESAILFRFGEIQRSDFEPGLHFRVPLVNTVELFDVRLRTLPTDTQRFLTGEKKDLRVDAFVKWRINDAEKFYRSTRNDVDRAGVLLFQRINDSLRNEFGKRTVQEIVSGGRGALTDIVTRTANERGEELGMAIVDVRLKRIDLPDEVSTPVYDRMRSERSRTARNARARGDKEAIRIQADADKQRTVIVAEAFRDAESLRGEGDALAAEIYARAYDKDREFYDFYRSLGAYRQSFAGGDNVLLLEPDSDFFKYFKSPGGSKK